MLAGIDLVNVITAFDSPCIYEFMMSAGKYVISSKLVNPIIGIMDEYFIYPSGMSN